MMPHAPHRCAADARLRWENGLQAVQEIPDHRLVGIDLKRFGKRGARVIQVAHLACGDAANGQSLRPVHRGRHGRVLQEVVHARHRLGVASLHDFVMAQPNLRLNVERLEHGRALVGAMASLSRPSAW